MTRTMTGGCQCGRVRYVAQLESNDAYLCHCRMCQRATGGFAASFVQVPRKAVTWESEPDWYASSVIAKRPFCSHCGTPFGFMFNDGDGMDLTLGSFDEPGYFHPALHSGAEGMHEAWLDTRDLPRYYSATTESVVSHWKAAGLEVPE
ncbi:GFA family protein [Novosphingobium sp.]|uniref:GFA family protein n=1 Tax=Novosphingobium sp. TaxID=1874826 RepID=UPI002FD8B3B1